MPRQARVVAVGVPHHITQRGSNRNQVFFAEHDHVVYLRLLAKYAKAYHLRMLGYCLMPNHVHVIGVPEREDSLARVFGRTHADYARYRNIARQQVGHFWQARYYSCPMDDWHVWRALAYVETNPVRASIVYQAGEYRWSSAAAHLADSDTTGLLDMGTWRRSYKSARWRRVLATSVDDEAAAERLREATRRGLPFGGEPFVKRLESETGRCLAFRGPGRPRTALAAAG